MRDIKVYYQPIDGERTDLAIFSKHGRSDLFIKAITRVVEEEELCEVTYPIILEGMYEMYCGFEDQIEIQRWMDCWVGETRMEWM